MLAPKILIVVTVFITSVFQIACSSTRNKETGQLNIIDVRNSEEPDINLASRKAHDVEVFRINFMGEGYKVRYYLQGKENLSKHEASYMSGENFDKAAFKRLSDTSIAIRLFNEATKKELKFEVFGNGPTSGIKD